MAMNSMYDDGPAQAPTSPEPSPSEPKEQEGDTGKTALLNSEICPGMEVGDEIVLKITGVKDGEYVVAYSPEPQSEDRPEEESQEKAPQNSLAMSGGMYD